MRIKKGCLSFLLILALPSMGSTAGSHTDVGVDFEVATENVSQDKFEASPAQSFLNPTYILQALQNAYLPPFLHLTRGVQTIIEPKESPSDFWDAAKKAEKTLQEYVPRLLEAAAAYFKSNKFTEITSSMHNIVNATATLRKDIQGTIRAQHISFDTLTQELEGVFMKIVDDLKKTPSPDKAPNHAERTGLVNKVLNEAAQALTELFTRYGVEEKVVAKYLLVVKPHVLLIVVTIGDINEQYPQLLPILLFSVACLLIPESWILKPFLSPFGFGPSGPVKGSAAAWMQRTFFGAAVKPGSWFAWLQAAGMGTLPNWAGLVKVPLFIGGLFALLLPCFRRR